MDIFAYPHRRYNPLTGEWVLVSPHRGDRPWLGQTERLSCDAKLSYDPGCYLCPGNERAGGQRNPQYTETFVFDNDFPALLPGVASEGIATGGLLRATSERGICRVVCFSPRHDLTLADMSQSDTRRIVDLWADQTEELGALDFVEHVQIFENKGQAMGASNPHPHCQVWANEHVPTEPAKELRSLSRYQDEHGSCLLCDYLALELDAAQRIVLKNEHFVAIVPFWAVWPFETMLLARRHIGTLPELSSCERDALADVVKRLTMVYDGLFGVSFPYSMGFHQSPTDGIAHREAHLHAHYYPPLLRSATVRKFMVGYEMLGNPQRDLTAENAAERLRRVAEGVGQ